MAFHRVFVDFEAHGASFVEAAAKVEALLLAALPPGVTFDVRHGWGGAVPVLPDIPTQG